MSEIEKESVLEEIRYMKNLIEESSMDMDSQSKCIDTMSKILDICQVNY